MPFDVNDRYSAMEENRLKFRYLELRMDTSNKNGLYLLYHDNINHIISSYYLVVLFSRIT